MADANVRGHFAGPSAEEEMEAFDELPAHMRDFLNEGLPLTMSAVDVLDLRDQGYSFAEIKAMAMDDALYYANMYRDNFPVMTSFKPIVLNIRKTRR